MMRPRTVTGPSGMMPEKSTADVRNGKPGSAHGAGLGPGAAARIGWMKRSKRRQAVLGVMRWRGT